MKSIHPRGVKKPNRFHRRSTDATCDQGITRGAASPFAIVTPCPSRRSSTRSMRRYNRTKMTAPANTPARPPTNTPTPDPPMITPNAQRIAPEMTAG
jgi:hypothetical protein